jgi:signal peptidase I
MQKLRDFWARNRGFLIGLTVLFAVRWSLADHYRVPSGSMEPTLLLGDDIFVQKAAYDFKIPFTGIRLFSPGEPERGDVVVFEHPVTGETYVKRLVGLPGDKLRIRDGVIESINGQPVPLETAQAPHAAIEYSASQIDPNPRVELEKLGEKPHYVLRIPLRPVPGEGEVLVPADSYFMMGDSRDNSSDSRFWGFVPRERLKGRAQRILWSLGKEGKNWPPVPRFARFGRSLD